MAGLRTYLLTVIGLIYCWVDPVRSSKEKPPNIILIVADDLGWNDVGWNNPSMLTPNLDVLAREGIILNSSYAQPVCTPSRAALLTGFYPYRIGMQHGVIRARKPYGVPEKYRLLPKELRKIGYDTHMVGKWHLGFCKWKFTPTFRGFKTFYGFYTGSRDYYTHRSGKERGYDFRTNRKPIKRRGIHSNDLFTKRARRVIKYHDTKKPLFLYMSYQLPHAPLQATKEYLDLYTNIGNSERRKYSAMVSMLDHSVGQIVSALMTRGMLNNTLIVFLSDNGGSPAQGGNNWPLRGAKGTLWEGGTRVPAFVWGSMLQRRGFVSNEMVHITDWFPTLLSAAGGRTYAPIDGMDQYDSLITGGPSPRREFIYNLNEINGRAALRSGPWKLIQGNPGSLNDWYAPPTWWSTPADNWRWRVLMKNRGERHLNTTQLFNIHDDPLERNNLADKKPMIVKRLTKKLRQYRRRLVHAANPRKVRKSHPRFWQGFWSPGWC